MKKLFFLLMLFPALAWAQCNPFSPNQILTASQLNSALSTACITSGTISGLSAPLPVASGGTNASSSSGTALDNITGFSSTGFMNRTGAGSYSFVASTGSGNVVLATSPILTTPNLGTPSSATLTNATGLPISSGVSGLGTGVATALGNAVTGSGGVVLATSPTIATPVITGVTNGSSAAAGSIGQYASGTLSSVSLTTGVAANCASVSLTAGNWVVQGIINFVPASTTTIAGISAGLGTTSASLPSPTSGAVTILNATMSTGGQQVISTPFVPFNVTTTTTIYLVSFQGFGTSTMTCNGTIQAWRAH